jgi:hypothetical protein
MSRKITIFQFEDTENSPKTMDIMGSSLLFYYIPRTCIKEFLKTRNDFKKPGIYILKFDSKRDNFTDKVYIGEGEPLVERLNKHLSDTKQDFKECVTVISTKDELTKAHIKHIESKLYKIAVAAKSSAVYNSNVPAQSSLSEADEAVVNNFIEQIKFVLPLCGFNCFISNTVDAQSIKGDEIFKIEQTNFEAQMVIEQNYYVVTKGSNAKKNTAQKYPKLYLDLRKKLIDDKILLLKNDVYVFTKNYKFTSSSKAASVVLGYSVSGLEFWKNDNGDKLKDV